MGGVRKAIKPGLLRWAVLAWTAVAFSGLGFRLLADCSSFGLPFTDLGSETTFCAAIAEAYYTGLTNGTSATTFSPSASVTRAQMAAFVTRTLDATLSRGSRRAALNQWWNSTPHFDQGLGITSVQLAPQLLQSDGADIWVANNASGTVSRVRASDGKLLETWTGATGAFGVLVAMGRVFVTGYGKPGNLYMIDPSQTAGGVTVVASTLGGGPEGIAFDGNKIWTANEGGGNGVSIITPGTWDVTTVSSGFESPMGILFDGTNIWVTDQSADSLLKLDSSGGILQTVAVGQSPMFPVFDGHNIWVPNWDDNTLTVVRATDGTVLKTFSAANGDANGLEAPTVAAFDGQRILVASQARFSLFKATDLSVIGNVLAPNGQFGACSDGASFWVSWNSGASIERY